MGAGKVRATIFINEEECKGCELCVTACPVDGLSMSTGLNDHGYHPVHYRGDGCTGCGVCFYVCPEPGAITVLKKQRTVSESAEG